MQAQLETCLAMEKSELWKENGRMFDYEKYVLRLPEPVLLRVLRFLRLPDLILLKSVCPELTDYCNLNIRLLDQEFAKRPFFQFERCAPEKDVEEDDTFEIMSERQNASMVYYPGNQSVYLFGGETLESNEDAPAATFNDLWRLDTSSMKWSRVIISSAPYPTPKCHASLVVWKEKLILFGGRASTHNRNDTFYSEVHFFHVDTSTWEYITTDGACRIGGHSAIATDNYMITYGQCESVLETSVQFLVLDMRTRFFNTVDFDGVLPESIPNFPGFDPRKSKLVLIRNGLILLTGEMLPGNYGSSVLIEFDPEADVTPERLHWKWKRVETIGRWWRPKDPPNDECSLPNFDFYEIADVRNSHKIRLISLGKLKNEFQSNRIAILEKYDAVQTLYREFCRQLKCHLEAEFQKRTNSEDKNCDAIFKYHNITCRIEDCFINEEKLKLRQNSHRFKVKIRIDSPYFNPNMPSFDDFDKWELRASIRALVNQLHSKYYNIGRMDQLAARVPLRNSALKRLSIYVAEIDCDVEFDNFETLCWHCQPIQYQSPVETRDFCLVGAHHDVIMHAGCVKFNESMRRMGQTTLLTPISQVSRINSSSSFFD